MDVFLKGKIGKLVNSYIYWTSHTASWASYVLFSIRNKTLCLQMLLLALELMNLYIVIDIEQCHGLGSATAVMMHCCRVGYKCFNKSPLSSGTCPLSVEKFLSVYQFLQCIWETIQNFIIIYFLPHGGSLRERELTNIFCHVQLLTLRIHNCIWSFILPVVWY